MHIILVSDFAYVEGGASSVCLGSAKALASRGHRVTLFTGVGPIAPDLMSVENLEVLCLEQHEILNDPDRWRAVRHGLWNGAAAASFSRYLASLDPTECLVHVHTWTKALSSSVIRTALEKQFRVVLTLHDYFSACPTGSFFLHGQQQICHLRPMSAACIATNCDSRSYGHKVWRLGRQWMQEHRGQLPSGISDFITLSDLSEGVLRPFLPEQAQVHRIPNFVAAAKEVPIQADRNERFCFVGRLSPEKGPQLLAEATKALAIETVFVGDGPLRADVAALSPRSVITGWLSPDRVRGEMRSARALVLPSLWYETQGLVVAEAASIGLPALVPSTSAAREWIKHGVNGLIFKGGDQADLQTKLAVLRDHPQLVATLGKNAYEAFWKAPPTMSRHCEALERVYHSMLGMADEEGKAAEHQQPISPARTT